MVGESLTWLLDPSHPTVRRLAAARWGGRPDPASATADEPWVAALLREPEADRPHPYQKWTGVHWRLVSLAELEPDTREAAIERFVEDGFARVTTWVSGVARLRASRAIKGRVRQCASMDGNAAWAAIRLGRGSDPAVEAILARLLEWQWPDGGWNCDKREAATHSSFNETLAPLRALAAFARSEGAGTLADQASAGAARAAEFLLEHRVDRSHHTGEIAHPALPRLRWPAYWHYDRLGGLRALREAGKLNDPRASQALDDLAAAATEEGIWRPAGRYWLPPGPMGTGREVVDWTSAGEERMLTLLAFAVLEGGPASH